MEVRLLSAFISLSISVLVSPIVKIGFWSATSLQYVTTWCPKGHRYVTMVVQTLSSLTMPANNYMCISSTIDHFDISIKLVGLNANAICPRSNRNNTWNCGRFCLLSQLCVHFKFLQHKIIATKPSINIGSIILCWFVRSLISVSLGKGGVHHVHILYVMLPYTNNHTH